MTELRECPFCGGMPVYSSGMGEYWVLCSDCKASGKLYSSVETAADMWNTRHGEEMKAIDEWIDSLPEMPWYENAPKKTWRKKIKEMEAALENCGSLYKPEECPH